MLEVSTFLYVDVLKVACIYSAALVESSVLVEAAALNSDIDLTLNINGAPLIGGSIYEL